MARKPRFTITGVPQHIIQRGNNREPCFYSVEDYICYLEDLRAAAEHNGCAVHAYVLMTNHVHLLATPFTPHGISHMMQDLGRKYVRYINHTYRRSGTLWEGRFKASLVDSETYLLTCMRYIELNPVRALMVAHPGEYRWSSYARNAMGKNDQLIQRHPLYDELASSEQGKLHAYRELFRHHLDGEKIHDIRNAVNQELVLGRADFAEKIAQMTSRQTTPAKMGRPRIQENRADYFVGYVY